MGDVVRDRPTDIEAIRAQARENLKNKGVKHVDGIKMNSLELHYLSVKYRQNESDGRWFIPLEDRVKMADKLYPNLSIDYNVKQHDPYKGFATVKALMLLNSDRNGKRYSKNGTASKWELPSNLKNKLVQVAEHNAKNRLFDEVGIPKYLDEVTTIELVSVLEQNEIVVEYTRVLIEHIATNVVEAGVIEVKEETTIPITNVKEVTEVLNPKRKEGIKNSKNAITKVVKKKQDRPSRGQIKAMRTRLMIVMENKLDRRVTAAHFIVLHKLENSRADLYIKWLNEIIRENDIIIDAKILSKYEDKANKFIKKITTKEKGEKKDVKSK